MLSSVLRSERAAIVNVAIMRAFVRLRQILATHDDLAVRIDELEHRYDAQFTNVFDMVRRHIARSGAARTHRISPDDDFDPG
jgi:hypothetical protein